MNYCLADNPSSIVIDPDGALYHCRHLPNDTGCGKIADTDIPPKIEKAALPASEECQNCCFLPICTPFSKIGCPVSNPHCREQKSLKQDYVFEKMASRILSHPIP